MARQKGLMKYVGTIGDVRHFKIKGQEGFFAGMVGGPTAEQVLHNLKLWAMMRLDLHVRKPADWRATFCAGRLTIISIM